MRIDILKTMAASFPIFMAFFYYLSRQYTEAYYQVYGIPSHLLSFRIEDYLYFGVRYGVMIIMAVAFTVLLVRLWQAFIIYRGRKRFYKAGRLSKLSSKRPVNSGASKRKIIRYLDIMDRFGKRAGLVMVIGYLFCFTVTLIILLSYTRTLDPTPTKYFSEMLVIALTVGWAILFLTDRKMFRFMLLKRFLYKAVTVATILIIVIYVQWLPSSIGSFLGMYDQNVGRASQVFNAVTIRTTHPFGGCGLEWQTTERGSYQNAEPLLLLHSSETSLFLISASKTDVTFCVDKQDVLSLTFYSGR